MASVKTDGRTERPLVTQKISESECCQRVLGKDEHLFLGPGHSFNELAGEVAVVRLHLQAV